MTFREIETSTSAMWTPPLLQSLTRSTTAASLIILVSLAILMLVTSCAGGSPSMVGTAGATPVIVAVTPLASPANAYKVDGSNFAAGLAVQVSKNGSVIESLNGIQITGLTANSFAIEIEPLPPGTYSLQVFNPDHGRSAPFLFTVVANQ